MLILLIAGSFGALVEQLLLKIVMTTIALLVATFFAHYFKKWLSKKDKEK